MRKGAQFSAFAVLLFVFAQSGVAHFLKPISPQEGPSGGTCLPYTGCMSPSILQEGPGGGVCLPTGCPAADSNSAQSYF